MEEKMKANGSAPVPNKLLNELSHLVEDMGSRIKLLENKVACDGKVIRNVHMQIWKLTNSVELTHNTLVQKLDDLLQRHSAMTSLLTSVTRKSIATQTRFTLSVSDQNTMYENGCTLCPSGSSASETETELADVLERRVTKRSHAQSNLRDSKASTRILDNTKENSEVKMYHPISYEVNVFSLGDTGTPFAKTNASTFPNVSNGSPSRVESVAGNHSSHFKNSNKRTCGRKSTPVIFDLAHIHENSSLPVIENGEQSPFRNHVRNCTIGRPNIFHHSSSLVTTRITPSTTHSTKMDSPLSHSARVNTSPHSNLSARVESACQHAGADPSDNNKICSESSNQAVRTESPVNHSVRADSPASHSVRTESPANHAMRTDSPNNHSLRTDSPANHSLRTDSPANHSNRTDSPANHSNRTDSPANHSVRTDCPTNHSNRTDSSANHSVHSDASTKSSVVAKSPSNRSALSDSQANHSERTDSHANPCTRGDLVSHTTHNNSPHNHSIPNDSPLNHCDLADAVVNHAAHGEVSAKHPTRVDTSLRHPTRTPSVASHPSRAASIVSPLARTKSSASHFVRANSSNVHPVRTNSHTNNISHIIRPNLSSVQTVRTNALGNNPDRTASSHVHTDKTIPVGKRLSRTNSIASQSGCAISSASRIADKSLTSHPAIVTSPERTDSPPNFVHPSIPPTYPIRTVSSSSNPNCSISSKVVSSPKPSPNGNLVRKESSVTPPARTASVPNPPVRTASSPSQPVRVISPSSPHGSSASFASSGSYASYHPISTESYAARSARIPIATIQTSPSESLLKAAESGNAEALLRLLETKPDVDVHQRNQDGDTALHLAAAAGHESTVIVLLGSGASVNAPGRRQRTALHLAASRGHEGVAQRLLIAGAHADAKDAAGDTALILAARHGHANVVSQILQEEVNVNCTDKDGRTPIMWGAAKGHTDIVKMLLHKAKLSETDKHGNTAHLLAAKSGHWDLVELLTRNGSLCNAEDKNGNTALELAQKAEQWEIVRLLGQRGAQATSSRKTSPPKNNPLNLAVRNGDVNAVRDQLLLVDYDDEQLETAFSFVKDPAVVRTFAQQARRVIRSEVGLEVMWRAAKYGDLDLLISVLDAGADLNARNSFRNTALHYASYHGHAECVRELLKRGALKNARGNRGRTPLYDACEQDKEDCARLLLAAGAYVKLKSDDGRTPMDAANSERMRLLLNSYLNCPLCTRADPA